MSGASGDPSSSSRGHWTAAREHVAGSARSRKEQALAVIGHVLRMSNISQHEFDEVVHKLKRHARVALHFHPDRLSQDMETVADGLLRTASYKSQFETQISNGSVTAFSGGFRDRWEERLFGGAYQGRGVSPADRPKYGALDLMRHSDGPAPRFGSCYFLLKPQVSECCTFTYLDSHEDPQEKGTYEEFDDVLAALLAESFTRDFAIGEHSLSPRALVSRLADTLAEPVSSFVGAPPRRNLNHYIEAQVHGLVRLAHDVDSLVADPSFRGTRVGDVLKELCSRFSIALHWHPGFVLKTADVPDDFRGPGMPSLARRIATAGVVDACTIGVAVRDLLHDPQAWRDRGDSAQVLQELKLLWHCLVRYGSPR